MLLSMFGLMKKSEVCGLVSYTNECEERLNSYEAALEDIAAQVTPGANATVKRMGKIALDALNVESV